MAWLKRFMKKTILILAVLLAVAFSVRLVIAFNTYVISSDGPFYLSVAKDFADGDFKQALIKQTFHQLYPFAIAVASKFISNWEWAGMLASIILSSLGVIPLYFIARKYFSDAITIIACLLYCFHPQGAQLSAAIFTTGMHISILLFAIWVTIAALETGKNLYFILAGILAFAMYLKRPDGLAFLGLTLLGIMFLSRPNDRTRPNGSSSGRMVGQAVFSWREKGVKAICLVIPWLFMFIPYLFVVESATGIFGLTGKVSAEAVTDIGITKSFGGLYQFVVEFIKGANPILFIFWLVGLVSYIRNKEKPFKSAHFAWLVFAGFMVFFAVYAFTHGRMSKRYTVPLFLMMLPWTAAGIYYLGDKISSRATSKVVSVLIIILLMILSVFTFKPVGKDKVIEKTTGELLKKYHSARSNRIKSPVIITTLSRIAYYAGGTNIMPEGWDKDDREISDFLQSLKDSVRWSGADYIVLDSRIIRKFPEALTELSRMSMEKDIAGISDNVRAELISVYFNKGEGDSYKVYRFSSILVPVRK